LAALEGFSCGKTLVTTDVEGSEEMIIEGITGRIVPKEDPAALTEAMRYLMEQPETRQEMGRQARRFMLEQYTWDKVANKYMDLYSTLICR
jgi:glycosyltransferase involved in cell wall biosynthesis